MTEPTPEQMQALATKIVSDLLDQGRIVEVGWTVFRATFIPIDCSEQQIADLRMAYYAGAQHLFASVLMCVGSPDDEEPTAEDMQRMANCDRELDNWKRNELMPALRVMSLDSRVLARTYEALLKRKG